MDDAPAPRPSGARWFDRPAPAGFERLPAVEEALRDVARAWTEIFTGLSSSPGEAGFQGLHAARSDSVLGRRGEAGVIATLAAPAWDATLVALFDRTFVGTVVEAMFGGDGDDLATGAPEPELSPVESRLAEVVAGQVAEALARGFADLRPTPFVFGKLQPKPDATVFGKGAVPLVVATFRLATLGRTIELDVVVPQAALMAIEARRTLAADVEAPEIDPLWAEQLGTEVTGAPVPLLATLEAEPMSLGALARLRPGQVIALPRDAGLAVSLACQGEPLFRCALGQSAGFYTVRVEEAAISRRKPC